MEPWPSVPDEPEFGLSGGRLCLDFANTWGDRARPQRDGLRDYGGLLAFSRQAGVLAGNELAVLTRYGAEDPVGAAATFARAFELREVIARLFAAAARAERVDPDDLERLNLRLVEALAHLRLEPDGDGVRWRLRLDPAELDAPLWPIAHSAAELLASAELDRVRECDGSDCTWLFLDQSRSRSRRWCSMQSCGNRAKARRHYRRLREV